ncbi:hypothetical protein D4764_10G0007400, partial [Takifugu flavidus]
HTSTRFLIAIVADLYDVLTPVSVSVCAAELEFVQIIIIIVVMTVMVVVIICLLNHYKLSTWSFITRQSQARRHDHALQQPLPFDPDPGFGFSAASIIRQLAASAEGYKPLVAGPSVLALAVRLLVVTCGRVSSSLKTDACGLQTEGLDKVPQRSPAGRTAGRPLVARSPITEHPIDPCLSSL